MEKNFKSLMSTIPPRGQVLDVVELFPKIPPKMGAPDETSRTLEVGTDAQKSAQRFLPIPQQALSPEFQAYFWGKVNQCAGCWSYPHIEPKSGYGRVRVGGDRAQYQAHRVAYFIATESDPGEFLVCHHCDNRTCVRPDHLFLGTNADNSADMKAKGRWVGADNRGAKNPGAKLSEEDAKAVIRLLVGGLSNKQIAAISGVGHAMISRIRVGRAWTHIASDLGYEPKPSKLAPKSGKTGVKRR